MFFLTSSVYVKQKYLIIQKYSKSSSTQNILFEVPSIEQQHLEPHQIKKEQTQTQCTYHKVTIVSCL